MKAMVDERYGSSEALQRKEVDKPAPKDDEIGGAFAELKHSVHAALETYSNVHRGSGHSSIVTTHLYEQARDIVVEYLGLDKNKSVVIFCTPRGAALLQAQLAPGRFQCLSSQDIGLSLGVRVLAVDRGALPSGAPFQTGGGTARLVSPGWVIWAKAPDKFEAGTPPIVNVIAFAKALRLMQHFGKDAFQDSAPEEPAALEEAAEPVHLAAADILYRDELEQYTGHELLDALRQTLIGRGIQVPTVEGARSYINLDNAASTPTFTPVWDAAWQAWRQPRRVQKAIIQEVRSICAGVLGASLASFDVIFTSNTTEAINLAAESLRNETGPGTRPVVVNTLLEHNSNELPWRKIPGATLIRLPVDAEGFVDLNELETLLRAYNQKSRQGKGGTSSSGGTGNSGGTNSSGRIRLVAVSGASNVLGTCNHLAEISRIVHRYGAHLLVDAAQLIAHRKVEMEAWGIDYLAFSAHKAYAPFGSGVLLARKGLLHFPPADLERIQSSGEENVGGIAALGKALVLLRRIGLDVIQAEEQALTGRALRGMAQIPGLTIYGIQDPASPRFAQKGGVIAFSLKDMMANRVARELAERGGIGVRGGCHCAHMLIKRLVHISPRLELLQGLILTLFPQVALPGVARVSLGIENSAADIDTLIQALGKIVRQPRAGADNPFASKHVPQTDIERQMNEFARAAAQKVYAQHTLSEKSKKTQ